MRHEQTHANEATIEKALERDYRTEHLFALRQPLEAFDHYQANPGMRSANCPTCPKSGNQFRISGVDLTQIDGINESAALGLISEIGINMSAPRLYSEAAARLALIAAASVPGSENQKGSSPPRIKCIYRMMKYGRDYADIGQDQYEKQFKERALRSLARRANEFGLQLVSEPTPEKAVP
jgi:transposase